MKAYQFISLALITLLVFSSCGKYEEGPDFSLRTKKKRLVGIWALNEFYENGYAQNEISFFLLIQENSNWGNKRSRFEINYKLNTDPNIKGEWEFAKNKEVLRLRYYNNENNQIHKMEDWRIMRLDNKFLAIEYEENENHYRMEFSKYNQLN